MAAIEEFQRRVVKMAVPDGRVDPGGKTIRALDSTPHQWLSGCADCEREQRRAGEEQPQH